MILDLLRSFKRRLGGEGQEAYDRGMNGDAGPRAAVRGSDLFRDLDETQAQAVAALLRPFSAGEHETLFQAGAPVERLLLLRSGRAGVGEPVLTTAGPGDALGELALNGPATHTATAHALEPLGRVRARARRLRSDRARGRPGRVHGAPAAFAACWPPGSAPRATEPRRKRPRPAAGDTGPARRRRTAVPSHAARTSRSSTGEELETLADSLRTWELDAGATLFTEGSRRPLRVRRPARRDRGDPRARRPPASPRDGRARPHARRALADRRRRADRDLCRRRARVWCSRSTTTTSTGFWTTARPRGSPSCRP